MSLSASDVHGNIGEFQRSYLYMLFWEGATYPEATKYFSNQKNVNDVLKELSFSEEFKTQIDIYNKKAFFPKRSTQEKKIPYAGEFFDIPTVDTSVRNGEMELFADEPMKCYKFFLKLKELTGDEKNHASVWGKLSKFNLAVAQYSVDKKNVTLVRQLVGCRVYGIELTDNDKSATDESTVKVAVRWDRNVLVDEANYKNYLISE